jgi:hypothetical protein
VAANDPEMDGAVAITDCVFSGVWNRSSVGQRWETVPNQCSNGWSPSIMTGGVGSLTVSNCLFDDFDVALQPSGTIAKARFTGNTLSACAAIVSRKHVLYITQHFVEAWGHFHAGTVPDCCI